MRTTDEIPDLTLVRLFTEARAKMDLPAAIRFVIAEAERIRRADLPQAVLPVVDEVAQRFGTTRDAIIGREPMRLTLPRQVAWIVLHDKFDLSYPALGDIFDGRHHACVLKAVHALHERMRADASVRVLVEAVAETVWAKLGRRAA